MAMTGGQMVEEVRANIRRSSDALSNDRIITWVNWAQGQLADWHTYNEMHLNYTSATVDGQKKYGFPTNLKDIYTMTLQDGNNSRKLVYVFPRDFDTVIPRPEQTSEGKPNYYVDYGLNFELYRIPDAAYTINLRGSTYPTDFSTTTTGTTSSLLRKDALICAVATMFGFLSLRELEDATYWKSEVASPLYQSSLSADHTDDDWTPVARGFSTYTPRIGEYVSDPLVHTMP